jgi:demethylmenaquinone methyltransferase/2-methoxy-6-polyprenyl-1,4-benzoquinol methylase
MDREQREDQRAKQQYDRAYLLSNIVLWPLERLFFGHFRWSLLHELSGRILEVGVGTGKNLPYYDHQRVQLTGVDLSQGLLKRACRLSTRLHFPVDLRPMDAEHLEFPDQAFDVVVCTFVLCSVPSPILVLQEMARVLKPDGQILMLEHVLSQIPHLARLQHWMGTHMERDTLTNIARSGLLLVGDHKLMLGDIIRRLECRTAPPLHPSQISTHHEVSLNDCISDLT